MENVNYRLPGAGEAELLSEAHRAIGRAMAHWQHLETALFILAHCLMGTDAKISSICFFHIKSADNRTGLIDKLCWHTLGQAIYASDWTKLKKRIQNMTEIRNGLAHFELATFDLTPGSGHPTAFPIAITPHHLDAHSYRNGGSRGLYLERLIQLGAEFSVVAEEILDFALQKVPDAQRRAESLPHNLRQTLESRARRYCHPE